MRIEVADKILEYGQVIACEPLIFCPKNPEADTLVKTEPLAFLFAVIMDQGALSEGIFEIPYHLKSILGHLDAPGIADMPDERLLETFEELPRKPRYPGNCARWIKKACQRVCDDYDGNPAAIWGDEPRAGDLVSRLWAFDGIGQKKASMAANILYRDLKVPLRNLHELDVSFDVQVRRVFLRALLK